MMSHIKESIGHPKPFLPPFSPMEVRFSSKKNVIEKQSIFHRNN